MNKVLDLLIKAMYTDASFDKNLESPPSCILWPDQDRQWETVIDILQKEISGLLVLGEYSPEKRTGPAVWLRCVIAEKINTVSLSAETIPVIYLPGYSRQDLRPVESCPDILKPLVELQYRGHIWSQVNNKDWTILAFLQSKQGGLGLDVAQDTGAKNAMKIALPYLLDEDAGLLKGKHLDSVYFNTLLSGDPDREFLKWLDQGEEFKKLLDENKWNAFLEICKSKYNFNPQNDGNIAAASRLAIHEGPWRSLWERFCESPGRYPNIPALIKKCLPPNDTLLWNSYDGSYDGWPQWNTDQETILRQTLVSLTKLPAPEARKKLLVLEEQHKRRRSLVWAELGEAPLASSLKYLAIMAQATQKDLNTGTIHDMAKAYTNYGWRADLGVLKSLSFITHDSDYSVIADVIQTIYRPWAEESARYLQNTVRASAYPFVHNKTEQTFAYQDGDCVLFVDGLRFDTAKYLVHHLQEANFAVAEEVTWAALPTITATGKPAVSPVSAQITGREGNVDFEPVVEATGQGADSNQLKKLFVRNGWLVLDKQSNGDGKGKAWCEIGDIDKEGHERDWKLARHIDSILKEIKEKIILLIDNGWKRLFVVTDHGWLLLPGGLPKSELHKSLTENKWGRCAALKQGVTQNEDLYQWYWNPNQFFALPNGISCYIAGKEYAHGGLSLQECLTLNLIITNTGPLNVFGGIKIPTVNWKGFRCYVILDGNSSGLSLDIRVHAGDPSSSVVKQAAAFHEDGTASVLVEDDSLEGKPAVIVVLNRDGTLASQVNTVISGSK
jgi:hypothetical protein